MTRRAMLAGLAGAAGVALVQTATGRVIQTTSQQSYTDPTKVLGSPSSSHGVRSEFVQMARATYGRTTISKTPLQDLFGTLTPADLHFERHHAGIPRIDPERHHLIIHGLVERPLKFTLQDLMRFPAVSRMCFLECSGNLSMRANEQTTPQDLAGLTSQSEWTGVPLAALFREVGIKPKASWFLAEGSDASVMTRSIPLAKAWDDAMIAYAQNGEPIRPAQGYPFRLLLPGWEGNANVKWLRRIEVGDAPFMTREETARYSEPLKNGTIRQFSFVLDARSLITFPAYPTVLEKGWVEIRGLAWSGRGRIRQVDLSTNGGRTWQPATLQAPVLSKAHTRFRMLWNWDGQATEIMSRAVDETGYVQPTRSELIAVRGIPASSYHLNPIAAWHIRRDGQVLYRPEDWG